MKYRYRWIYSENYGEWFYTELPPMNNDEVREIMDYIEKFDGPRYGCRWSGFEFEEIGG